MKGKNAGKVLPSRLGSKRMKPLVSKDLCNGQHQSQPPILYHDRPFGLQLLYMPQDDLGYFLSSRIDSRMKGLIRQCMQIQCGHSGDLTSEQF